MDRLSALIASVLTWCNESSKWSASLDKSLLALLTPSHIASSLKIFNHLGSGHLALMHPHINEEVTPENVATGVVCSGGVNEITGPVWRAYADAALEFGELKCLPLPIIVDKGLGHTQEALSLSKAGVSGTK